MGTAAERNGGFGEERAASEFPKDRPRKTEGLCGRASGRIPVGDGGGVWMQRKRYTRRPSTVWDNTKKKTTGYQEQDQEKVAAYQEQIQDIPAEKIAYVDECGIDTYLYREYGYAPQGQQVFGRIKGRKYQRCGIVAAKMGDKILAPFQYSGTMDSSLFEETAEKSV